MSHNRYKWTAKIAVSVVLLNTLNELFRIVLNSSFKVWIKALEMPIFVQNLVP